MTLLLLFRIAMEAHIALVVWFITTRVVIRATDWALSYVRIGVPQWR